MENKMAKKGCFEIDGECFLKSIIPPYIVVMVVFDEDNREIDRFMGRCKIEGHEDWNPDNSIFPSLEEIPITHTTCRDLLQDLIKFWLPYKYAPISTLTEMAKQNDEFDMSITKK